MLLKALKAAIAARNRVFNILDPPVVILIYHRVTTLASDPQLLAVTPENFRAQLRFLKDHFPILRLEDDWGAVKEPSVVITFDDGYADNALEALPVLEEVGVPATFFVSTGGIGTSREFWWDELERVILGSGPFPSSFLLQDESFRREWPAGSERERVALYKELHPLMKQHDASRREKWLQALRDWAGVADVGRPDHRPMTLDELRRLAASELVTIGAHTVTHSCLSALPLEEQRLEIAESKRQLEAWTGREVTVFSYPFGCREDYTRETVRICRDIGFRKVAANVSGQAHRWTDPFQLPRQLVRNWPVEVFAAKLAGYWVL